MDCGTVKANHDDVVKIMALTIIKKIILFIYN